MGAGWPEIPARASGFLVVMRACMLLILMGCQRGEPVPDGGPAWNAMVRALPGRWHVTRGDGSTVEVAFKLVSNGSALVETFGNPGHETLTVYHRDGAALLATHYCAQGNQPRLRARAGDPRHPVLELMDATDVDPGEAELVELSYDLGDLGAPDFDRVEVYRQPDGTLERTPMHFSPVRS
jgi:hypothetical protein